MNLILERSSQVRFYTDMAQVLRAAGIAATDYDWYVSDVESYPSVEALGGQGQWLTGARLAEILQDPIQFIFAVFSAAARTSPAR